MKIRFTPTLFIMTFLMAGHLTAQEITEDTLVGTVAGIQQSMETKNRLKISGYIQTQFQVTDSAGSVGFAGGNFASGQDKRFQLRRGRIKFQYDGPMNDKGWSTAQYVLQFDVTQGGLTIKDAWVKFTDPWSGWFSVTAGMQNRPYGYEIPFSSSLRESPERGRMSQIILPNERDLGAMLTIQGPKTSNWNWIKIDVGMFNGTGAPGAGVNASDFDKFKDLIGHIGLSKSNKSEEIKWGLGASIYNGGFRQDVSDRYIFGTDNNGVKGYIIDLKKADVSPSINVRDKAKRNYVGADGQISIASSIGLTSIRAEYLQGEQSALSGSSTSISASPTSTVSTSTSVIVQDTSGATRTITTTSTSTVASDIYVRKFNGAYLYFVQTIGHTPWQVIVKYDWYDPNTDLKGDEIGKAVASGFKTSNATDLKYTTLGLGLAYRWDANVKITAYYDMVKNETSQNLNNWTNDVIDNVFTLRVQVKF